MITKNKLLSLNDFIRNKKCANILFQLSHKALEEDLLDYDYVNMILDVCNYKPIAKKSAQSKSVQLSKRSDAFYIYDVAQDILSKLKSEKSDFDYLLSSGELDKSKRIIQDKILILDEIRSPYNVGAIFRSADSFGIRKILLTEKSANPEHPHSRRTARGCIDTVEWEYIDERDLLKFLEEQNKNNKDIIALETGGESLKNFKFSSNGVLILGNEELGIRPVLLEHSNKRVEIPMGGCKGSLNVSVCAGIFLCNWYLSSIE